MNINKQIFIHHLLKDIQSDLKGYNKILKFGKIFSEYNFSDNIIIQIEDSFDVSLCALLGVYIEKYLKTYNIIIKSSNSKLHNIGFLENFNYERNFTKHSKLKQYFHIKTKEESKSEVFKEYVNSVILDHKEFPKISKLVKKEIAKSIFEIFDNANIHSESDKIYICSFLDEKEHELHFSIVDSGIGFAKKLNNYFGQKFSSENAIKWAIKEGNTTKKQTGGLGFKLIMEFIKLNKGKLQILSGDCLYEMGDNKEKYNILDYEFYGSMVNMIFKTNDTNSYQLKIEDDDLF
ncbi:TPA: sensor histidine kinase [Campylobacter lari]|nr:sensor histidine kinase [Campylobacter lari]